MWFFARAEIMKKQLYGLVSRPDLESTNENWSLATFLNLVVYIGDASILIESNLFCL